MNTLISGLHHLTAIATNAQTNVDFYAGLLGLRLVKRTVNFDDPTAYHLYYGDETGSPGSIITFFYWADAPRGQVGAGQVTSISFSAPPAALEFWRERLLRHGVKADRRSRFGEDTLSFADPDGIPLEIVAAPEDGRAGWSGGGVPEDYALRGMHTAELMVAASAPTEALLVEEMGYRLVRREGNRARFSAGPGGPGRWVDVVSGVHASAGLAGAGTVHHLAFRVASDADQLAMRSRLTQAGYFVSDVRDRNYFHSIYYRERGGILFEIATDVPGFAVDEPAASLGEALKLPTQYERARGKIENLLPKLQPARQYA